MENSNKDELVKIKKVRRILLLKINDELKDILKKNSFIKINSKTIPELNKLYTLNDVQLHEKPSIYFNYVKTEEKEVSRVKSKPKELLHIKISKSMKKMRIKRKQSKVNLKVIKDEKEPSDEESMSPLNSFIPKKVELGKRKMAQIKINKNKGSIPTLHHKMMGLEKFNDNKSLIISQSTRMNKRDLNLDKLIGRITCIKDNVEHEDIIKESIQKLRNYCYQLRKKKKKPKKILNYIFPKTPMNRDREKVKERENEKYRKRNAIKNTLYIPKPELLYKSFYNSSKKANAKSPNFPNSNNSNKKKNSNILNFSKPSLSPSKPESSSKKALFSLEKKKPKKEKKSNKNSIKTMGNMSVYDKEINEIPDVFQINKKGIPFFHKTTVDYEDDIVEKGRNKRRSEKKRDSKDLLQRKKHKSQQNDNKNTQQLESKNSKQQLEGNNKFLGLNYIYRNNNKKIKTKIETRQRLNSHKKLLKIDIKKDDYATNNQPIIKYSKVNNGEIQKKIKKGPINPIKEKRILRSSYISNYTDTNNYRAKDSIFSKSIVKK